MYSYDTLYEEEMQKSPFFRSRSRDDDFSQISLSTSGRQRVSRLRDMSRTTTHADYDQANKAFARLRFCSRMQSSLIGSLKKDDVDNSENVI